MYKKGVYKIIKFLKGGENDWSQKTNADEKYVLNGFGVEKESDLPRFCFQGIQFVKNLKEKSGASFFLKDNKAGISIKSINYLINSWEELLILDEIFTRNIYNINIAGEFTFIDIGMNAGMTSLYFAEKELCKKVIAFEPFDKTISFAKLNFGLNKCATKIQLHPYGLGYPARTIQVQYSEEYKGSVGINGVAPYIGKAGSNVLVEMEIIDVAAALEAISGEEGNIIIKIDCEGAEYEILERLSDANLLKKINCFMVEWHLRGPASLIEIFLKNNYSVFSPGPGSEDIGMLYAFKNSLA